MAKKFKFRSALACEHITTGAGNKVTLINIYGGAGILVAELPANIWLSFYLEMESKHLPANLDIEVRRDSEVVGRVGVEVSIEDEGSPLNIILPSGLMKIDHECTIDLVVKAKGFEDAVAISRFVKLGDIPA